MVSWISMGLASDMLANRLSEQFTKDADYADIQSLSMRRVFDHVANGYLPARPTNPEMYYCRLSDGSNISDIALNTDGTIPLPFWEHYEGALDKSDEGIEGCWAGPWYWWWEFTLVGIPGSPDATIQGRAGPVEVRRDRVPGIPTTRGQRGPQYLDEDIFARAATAIRSGTMTPRQAVKLLASEMEGKNTTLRSKANRLRRRLKMKGLWPKK